MKFWKLSVVAIAVFCGIIITFLHSSCEKNACNNVSCQHGGSCSNGICLCPTGYEGPTCQTLATDRYLGLYVGYTQCDALSRTIDSVWVTSSTRGILEVDVKLKSIAPKILRGTINSTVSTYTILVANNDTTKTDTSSYYRNWSITLQNDKMLSISTFEQKESPSDSFSHKCYFLSEHKY
jgi:hypothetical protein